MSLRRYTVSIDDRSFVIDVVETAADRFEVSVDGQTFEATLHGDHDLPGVAISPEVATSEPRQTTAPEARPGRPPAERVDRPATTRPTAKSVADRALTMTAPMPGVVLEVLVTVGARLNRGDPILVLEAMKMRNTIRCPREAVIEEISVAAGQPVASGDPLVRLGAAQG